MSKRYLFAGLLRSYKDYTEIPQSSIHRYQRIPLQRGFTEIKHIFEIAQKNNAFICGGYARRCASVAPIVAPADDVDIYTFSNDDLNRLLADILAQTKFVIERQSQFSITLKNKESFGGDIKKIQLVLPDVMTNNPKKVIDILDCFDFNICKCAIVSPSEAIAHINFMPDETYKTLLVDGDIKNPVMLFFRILKYTEKGYRVSPRLVIDLMTAVKTLQYKNGSLAKAVTNSVDYLKGKESGLMREFMFGNVFEPPTETNVEAKDEPF
jgi:hypothetical protein